jgi:small-conductance mechanosensitive channel
MGYKSSAEWNMVDRLVDWMVINDSQFQLTVLILFNFTLIAQVFVMMYYYFGNVVLLQFLQSVAVFVSMLVLYKLKK